MLDDVPETIKQNLATKEAKRRQEKQEQQLDDDIDDIFDENKHKAREAKNSYLTTCPKAFGRRSRRRQCRKKKQRRRRELSMKYPKAFAEMTVEVGASCLMSPRPSRRAA